MAKTYKPATERQIKRGKGVSTDELSFNEALKYFQARGKEKGMNRFRHKGKVYDLTGKEIASKAAPKATKPKDKPVAVTTTSADKPKSDRRSGATENVKSVVGAASDRANKSKTPTPNNTDKMRGDARTSARSRTSINDTKKKIRELQGQLDKNSAALAAASLGSGVLTRGSGAASGKSFNPTFGSQKLSPEGPQGRMNTTVGKPAVRSGGKGLPGTNPSKGAKQIARGGRKNTPQDKEDFNPFLN